MSDCSCEGEFGQIFKGHYCHYKNGCKYESDKKMIEENAMKYLTAFLVFLAKKLDHGLFVTRQLWTQTKIGFSIAASRDKWMRLKKHWKAMGSICWA